MKRIRFKNREYEDEPETDLSAFRGLDDRTVAIAAKTDPLARIELKNRLRFEAMWGGEWNSRMGKEDSEVDDW